MQIMQVINIQVAKLCCIAVTESLKRKRQTLESSVDPGATTVSCYNLALWAMTRRETTELRSFNIVDLFNIRNEMCNKGK